MSQYYYYLDQSKVNWLRGNIGYSSVQELHSRLRVLDFWLLYYSAIPDNVFKEYFFSAFADFGVPFSINFHSSSTILGFRKALEPDAMSSSDSGVRFLVC